MISADVRQPLAPPADHSCRGLVAFVRFPSPNTFAIKHAQGWQCPVGIIHDKDLVYAGHILPSDLIDVYLGYVMAEPKRHVAG